MPLMAMVTDALTTIKRIIPQISAIHFTPATLREAKSACFLFASPEVILSGAGRHFLQTVANIRAVFIDEFHIINAW